MSEKWPIAVCSWSLQVTSIPELEGFMRELELSWVHLALGDPHHASWEEDDETFIRRVTDSFLQVSASMLAFPGEDYTTPQTIQKTGGFGDPDLREERLKLVEWGARKTRRLGLDIMSCHAGFIPEPGDSGRPSFLDCLRRALDIAAAEDVVLAFETGQETASLLRATLDELNHPSAKVNFDPANMILYDKGDPIEAVKILGPDIVHVHVKDGKTPTRAGEWGAEVPLGEGQVGMQAYLDALDEIGYHGPLAIEREVGNQQERFRDVRSGAELLRRLMQSS
ncbi:MAG TPA: sugar phosphate isomerase/epimerase family protein [Acidobacteriota bacterium]|nr:sugar phosphate isomerase/epimerase family protein [Acidobacteriota bacterium]